jgi:glycosyltransferase involved in cell wall biosynthesis
MKFVLNTNFLNTAASMVCVRKLSKLLSSNGCTVVINDWVNYSKYDVAIFMSYDSQVEEAKRLNPSILVGIADPKHSSIKEAKVADFLLVSSIEQREYFLEFNRNIFIYYMIPEFSYYSAGNLKKDKVVIGYHGNRVHLDSFYENITPALEKLGEKYHIELHAIYNIKSLGVWKIGRPDESRCKVKDLQWYDNCYKDYFQYIDIGIVPSFYPMKFKSFVKKFLTTSSSIFLENSSDHLVKYKFSTNAGRIFVFGKFGLPVVADATPSSGDIIRDEFSGKLVLSSYGWYSALEDLIRDGNLRASLGKNLSEEIKENYSDKKIFNNFINFLLSNKGNFAEKKRTINLSNNKKFYIFFMNKMFDRLSNFVNRIKNE